LSITSVDTDYDNLTITLVAHFDAPIDQVWELWSDPRKLERWWGPPTEPATVEKHDLSPGGEVEYRMTGPDGDKHYGVRYPADPPTVEEIVAVMRHTSENRHGWRLRAMIVALWRAGLASRKRWRSPSTISTTGADRCWSATAREGADARSAWTSGAGSSYGHG
jgi:hypothetical protein